jgi:hypothetical protein
MMMYRFRVSTSACILDDLYAHAKPSSYESRGPGRQHSQVLMMIRAMKSHGSGNGSTRQAILHNIYLLVNFHQIYRFTRF